VNHFRFKISDFQFEILACGRQVQSKIENIILLEFGDVSEISTRRLSGDVPEAQR
jgi:hypothetical protein